MRCAAFPPELEDAIARTVQLFAQDARRGTKSVSNELLLKYATKWRRVKLGRSKYWYRDAEESEVGHEWEDRPTSPERIFFIDLIQAQSPRRISYPNPYYSDSPLFTQARSDQVLQIHFYEMVVDACEWLITVALGKGGSFQSPEEIDDFMGVKGPKGEGDVLWSVMGILRNEWARQLGHPVEPHGFFDK